MGARITTGVLLSLALAACARPVGPSGNWRTVDLYGVGVHLQYPELLRPNAARVNSAIQRWIGDSCTKSPMVRDTYLRHDKYRDARACVSALSRVCAAQEGGYSYSPTSCQATITVTVKMHTAGFLVLALESYGLRLSGLMGTPHPGWDYEFLNLDTRTGHVLSLGELVNLNPPHPTDLEREIVGSLRAQFHIPANRTLKQAGFDTEYPPIAKRVEVTPDGLIFVYKKYELKFPVGTRPRIMVPYSALSALIPATSPLRRLLPASGVVH